MKPIRLLFFITALMFTLPTLQSCKKSKKADADGTDTTMTDDSDSDSSADSKVADNTEKYNAYIDYFNHFSDRMHDAYDAYYENGEDFVPSEDALPRIYTLSSPSSEELKEYIDKKPSYKGVDGPAKDMVEAGEQINEILNDLEGYYSRKDYVEDDFKKGLEQDAKLRKLFDDYYEAYDKVNENFGAITEKVVQEDLKNFKKDGRMLSYYMLQSITSARKLSDYLNSSRDPNGEDLDVDKINTMLSDFRKHYDEVLTFKGKDDVIKEDLGITGTMGYGRFVDSADGFISSIRDFEERLKNKDFEYSPAHPNFPDDGTIEKINKEYSDMINGYNMAIR